MDKRKPTRVFRVFQQVAVEHEMAEPLTPSPSFVRTTRRPLCLNTAKGKNSSSATGDPYQCFRVRAGKAGTILDGMAQSRRASSPMLPAHQAKPAKESSRNWEGERT